MLHVGQRWSHEPIKVWPLWGTLCKLLKSPTHDHKCSGGVPDSFPEASHFLWSGCRSLPISLMTPWGNWIFYVTHMDLLIVEQTCCLNPSWYECIFTCTHIASMQMIFTNKFIDFALSYCNCDLHLYLGCTCQFPALLRGFLPCTAFSAHSNKSRTVFISPLPLSSDNMTLVTAKNRGEREGQLACSFTLYPFFTI